LGYLKAAGTYEATWRVCLLSVLTSMRKDRLSDTGVLIYFFKNNEQSREGYIVNLILQYFPVKLISYSVSVFETDDLEKAIENMKLILQYISVKLIVKLISYSVSL
jgi:hypothetical protein